MNASLRNTPDESFSSVGAVLDHLVDALGGDPSCTLRRALILADIDEHRGTTQTEIMARLNVNKSALNRDIEWLYDYGCILRQTDQNDARVLRLSICGYAKKNLAFALSYFDGQHERLGAFLNSFISMFGDRKPTLRDAKIVSILGHKKGVTKQEIFDNLYNGPAATDNRAVNNLINFGLVQNGDEQQT